MSKIQTLHFRFIRFVLDPSPNAQCLMPNALRSSAEGHIKIDYELVYGNPEDPVTDLSDQQHRMEYILSQKPAAFP